MTMRDFLVQLLFIFGCLVLVDPPSGSHWALFVRGVGIAMMLSAIDVRYARKSAKEGAKR